DVPFYFLARAGKATRLLQTRGGPDWPRIKQIAMTGEYPIATLRFSDPDLPVQVEMAAFSPFAPLDTRLSSIPAAVFVFRIHNPTDRAEEISLAALLMNPVGYDAAVRIEGHEHPNFGGNVNEVFHNVGATGLVLKAETGDEPAIDGKRSLQGKRIPDPARAGDEEVDLSRVPSQTFFPVGMPAGLGGGGAGAGGAGGASSPAAGSVAGAAGA